MWSESQILSKLYLDRFSLYRHALAKNEYGESVMERRLIYENIPCGLSLNRNSKPERTEVAHDKKEEYTLFADISLDIKDNDFIEVITSSGDSIRGYTGKCFKYPSHLEASVRVEATV